MRLTPFGKQVRKYRIDAGVMLSDMAEALEVTSSYLSAVETGRKPVNDVVVRKSITYFKKLGLDASDLSALADRSRKGISLENLDEEEREVVAAFARRLPDMTRKKKEALQKLLDSD